VPAPLVCGALYAPLAGRVLPWLLVARSRIGFSARGRRGVGLLWRCLLPEARSFPARRALPSPFSSVAPSQLGCRAPLALFPRPRACTPPLCPALFTLFFTRGLRHFPFTFCPSFVFPFPLPGRPISCSLPFCCLSLFGPLRFSLCSPPPRLPFPSSGSSSAWVAVLLACRRSWPAHLWFLLSKAYLCCSLPRLVFPCRWAGAFLERAIRWGGPLTPSRLF